MFEPIRIRGVDFRNRLELAPPSPNLADREGRVPTEFVDLFRSFARGGVAVLHVRNSVVDFREARDEERQLDLGTDDCILPLTRFAEMCAGYGALASLEINHNGKDSHSDKTGRLVYSSSSVIPTMERFRAPLFGRQPMPTIEMDYEKSRETVEKYATAAYRCKRAGFKMSMIHGAHGNLIAQFASRLYNKRTSERIEFPADTVLLAVGMAARIEIADSQRRSAPETEVFVVGDASEVGSIATAVRSAFKAAAYI